MTVKLTPQTGLVFQQLVENVENEYEAGWGTVYLDNARHGMSARSFAGCLSALKKSGLYRSQNDDCFGEVALDMDYEIVL